VTRRALPTPVASAPLADAAFPAREVLRRGGILALPTESSYGLAVDPRDATAIERIYRLKGRPAEKALPVVCAGPEDLVALGLTLSEPILAWALARWPAALTVLAPLQEPIAAAAGLTRLAVRIPGHAGLRGLVAELGGALTATSANPAGEEPYLDPVKLAAWLESRGVDALVVDGGALPGGPPSTLVEWANGGPKVVRPGRLEID